MTATGQVATRYASALIDLADQSKSIDQVEKDMVTLEAMMVASADLRGLISNPLFNRTKQETAMMAVAKVAGLSDLTQRFLGVLAHNRRLSALPSVIAAVKNILTRRRGGVEARVQTAVALTPAQTEALKKALSEATGSDVAIHTEVKPDLLGGMVVTVGSRMIDDSVKRKLERLKRALSGNRAA
jgi:F-type H+-transporting ATPase subunit delta